MIARRFSMNFLQARKIRRLHEKHMSTLNDEDKTTYFGFKTVRESEKAKQVYTVFEKVAESYDTMNDAMSLGIHRIWKDRLIETLSPNHGCKLLDSAGGTGDITFRYLNYLKNKQNPGNRKSYVTVCDINDNMLEVGQIRAEKLGWLNSSNFEISWRSCDAENLEFCKEEQYDAYTIAFGIRNVTHIEKVLSEAYRILNPGGRFLCLEFSRVDNDVLRWFYDRYSFQIIPVLGTLIAGQWQPYQYLVESIRQFPRQEVFKEMIEDAGFRNVTYENLSFGIVSIHSGFKL